MTDEDARPLIGWAILELMGHRRLAGYVTEQDVAGHGFLRIDVPGDERVPPVTQFYSPSAVYAITPTSEAFAHACAQLSRPEPVAPWELQRAQLREVPTVVEIERDDFVRGRPVDDDDFEQPDLDSETFRFVEPVEGDDRCRLVSDRGGVQTRCLLTAGHEADSSHRF